MGFKDKMRQAKEDGSLYKFSPIELTEGNVQAIFNRCLAPKGSDQEDWLPSILFQRNLGYEEDSKPIVFSKAKIDQNRKNILYLLGQFKSVHEDDLRITSTESIYRYDGVKWTGDTSTLMELYHLAEAAKGILPFVKKYNSASVRNTVVPTLSPKDPAFPAWWEAHKAEWER